MATYIVLATFTQQGIQHMKDAPRRRAAAKELAASLGGEIKESYLTTGRYDLVFNTEFPNEEAVAQLALRLGMPGNVRTETMLAFDGATVDRMVEGLGAS
jgi:uncharacterized protein with GYD domain